MCLFVFTLGIILNAVTINYGGFASVLILAYGKKYFSLHNNFRCLRDVLTAPHDSL